MGVAITHPPPPIVCTVSEHRAGRQVRIEALIRSDARQAGRYRLQVSKRGPSGDSQIDQESEFTLEAGASVRIRGLSLSLEPEARYRAVLSVRVGDADYTCERGGPEDGSSL
jgi:hypothetical protein